MDSKEQKNKEEKGKKRSEIIITKENIPNKKKSSAKNERENKNKSKSPSRSRSRSRSKSNKHKNINERNPLEGNTGYNIHFSYLSKEGKKGQINDFKPIEINAKLQENNSLFKRKENTLNILKNIKDIANIELNENILDNTLHEFQIIKLSNNIKKLNEDEKLIEKHKDDIEKSGIVLSEEEYNRELDNIVKKDLIHLLKYKNYKEYIIKCVEYLEQYNKNTDNYDNFRLEARKLLQLNKDFYFNNSIEISEENLYYYQLAQRLYMNIYIILDKFELFKDLLKRFKEFLKENNLNNINTEQREYYKIINFYLTDKKELRDSDDLEKLNELLSENSLSIDEIKKKVEQINNHNKDIYPKVHLNVNDKFLEFKYIKKFRLKSKILDEEFCSQFEINSFNKLFKRINYSNLIKNLDGELYECLIYSKMKNNNIIDNLIPYLKKAIMKITNSDAMKKFFNDTYGKYYDNLVYDFDKEEVIEEFFKRVNIIKLFNSTEAFSDPIDLRMYLPINPGKIKELTFLGDIYILRFGRLLLLIIHELLGHLMRRYYFYVSNGTVFRDTTKDNKMGWGDEGGKYMEKTFLGKEFNFLSIRDIISLLTPKKTYPIISEDDLTFENIKNVINEYKELFIKVSDKDINDDKTIPLSYYVNYLTILLNKSKNKQFVLKYI